MVVTITVVVFCIDIAVIAFIVIMAVVIAADDDDNNDNYCMDMVIF